MITLFRAVSQQEKEDYDAHGAFRTGRNTLEAKQFFKSIDAINRFVVKSRLQQYDPSYEYLLTVSVDKEAFDSMPYISLELDGYEAINIHEDNLPAFNNCVKFVKQEVL